MHSFLSKVFGRKKEDKETSPTTLRPGELLDGKFEAVSPNVSPGAANFLELDDQANAESSKDKDKDVVFSLFRAKSRPSPPEIRGKRPDTLPHLSLDFSAINGDSNANNLLTLDHAILSDAIIGRRRLNPMEAIVLIRACSQAIVSKGLETLGVMHPHWYSASPEVQRRLISQFIHSMEPQTPPTAFSPNSAIASPFHSEIESTPSPHDIAAVLRWGLRHLRLDGDTFGTDDGWYKAFLDAEAAAEYPPKAFTDKLAPLLPKAHLDILTATLELFSYLAAHSEANGTSGSKLSKIFGLWLLTARQVEDKDDWQSFYARWERTGRMLEHLFLSRIRDESTDQRMPVRLLELVRRYPYTQGLSSPSTDLQLLSRPPFTTKYFDAFFVRIEVELPPERRKPTLKVHPLNILADAFSTKVEDGEFAELWGKITAASKDGSNPSPLSNIFADETIRLLSIIPDKTPSKAAEPKSPTFSLLPISPSARGRSFSAGDNDKPPPVQHSKSATEPPPASAVSAITIGSDWAQFSSSGFLDTSPAIAPLVSTLFDTDIEKTLPPATPLSRKSSKRTKAASRKSVDFSAEPVKPIPEVPAEEVKEEPKSVVRATKLQVIQIDEAFIDFWSDSLLDPITASWPTFIICKFKSTLAPKLQYAPAGGDGTQKTLKWLVLEQVITFKPAPAPVLPASPSVSVSEAARPVSPALSTSGKTRFSFWSMSRTASSSSQSSQKGKKKEKQLNVGEMGELIEEESSDQVKSAPAKMKSFSKSRKSTSEKPRKSVDVAPRAIVPTSPVEAQVPAADKGAPVEAPESKDNGAVSVAAATVAAAGAIAATAAIANAAESQPPTSEVANAEAPGVETSDKEAQEPVEQEVKPESDAVAQVAAPVEIVETSAIETSAEPGLETAPVIEAKEESQATQVDEVGAEPVAEPLAVDAPLQATEISAIESLSVEPPAEVVPVSEEKPEAAQVHEVAVEAVAETVPEPVVEEAVVANEITPVQPVEDTTDLSLATAPTAEVEVVPIPAVKEEVTNAPQVPEVAAEAIIAEPVVEEAVVATEILSVQTTEDDVSPSAEPNAETVQVSDFKQEETETSQSPEVAAEVEAETFSQPVVDTQIAPAETSEDSAVEPPVNPVFDVKEENEALQVLEDTVEAAEEPVTEPVVEEVVVPTATTSVQTVEDVSSPAEPITEAVQVSEIKQEDIETSQSPEVTAEVEVEAVAEPVVEESVVDTQIAPAETPEESAVEPPAEPVSDFKEETEALQLHESTVETVEEPVAEPVVEEPAVDTEATTVHTVDVLADEISSAEPVQEVANVAEEPEAQEVSTEPVVEGAEAVVDVPVQSVETDPVESSPVEPALDAIAIEEVREEAEASQLTEVAAEGVAEPVSEPVIEESVVDPSVVSVEPVEVPMVEASPAESVEEIPVVAEAKEESEDAQVPEASAAPIDEPLVEETTREETEDLQVPTEAVAEPVNEPIVHEAARVTSPETLEVPATKIPETESPSVELVAEVVPVVEAKEETDAAYVAEVAAPTVEEAIEAPSELVQETAVVEAKEGEGAVEVVADVRGPAVDDEEIVAPSDSVQETEPLAEPKEEVEGEVEVEVEATEVSEPVETEPILGREEEPIVAHHEEHSTTELSLAESVPDAAPVGEANDEAEATETLEASSAPVSEPLGEEIFVDIPVQSVEAPVPVESEITPVLQTEEVEAVATQSTEVIVTPVAEPLDAAVDIPVQAAEASVTESSSAEPVAEAEEQTTIPEVAEVIVEAAAEPLKADVETTVQATETLTPESSSGEAVSEIAAAVEPKEETVPAETSPEHPIAPSVTENIEEETPIPESTSVEPVSEIEDVTEEPEPSAAILTKSQEEEATSVLEEHTPVFSDPEPLQEVVTDVPVEETVTSPGFEIESVAALADEKPVEEQVDEPVSTQATESFVEAGPQEVTVDSATVEVSKDLPIDSKTELESATEIEPAQPGDIVAAGEETLLEEPIREVPVDAQANVQTDAQEKVLFDQPPIIVPTEDSVETFIPSPGLEVPAVAAGDEPSIIIPEPSLEEPIAAPADAEESASETVTDPIVEVPLEVSDIAEVVPAPDAPQPTIPEDPNVESKEHAPMGNAPETLEEQEVAIKTPAPVEQEPETNEESIEEPVVLNPEVAEVIATEVSQPVPTTESSVVPEEIITSVLPAAEDVVAPVAYAQSLTDVGPEDEAVQEEFQVDAPREVVLQDEPVIVQTETSHSEDVLMPCETQSLEETSIQETISPTAPAEEEYVAEVAETTDISRVERDENQHEEISNVLAVVEPANPGADADAPLVTEDQTPTEASSELINIASSVPAVVPMAVPEESSTEASIDIAPVPLVEATSETVEGTHVTVLVPDSEAPKEAESVQTTSTTEDSDAHTIASALISAGSTPGPQASLNPIVIDELAEAKTPVSLDRPEVPEDNNISPVNVDEDLAVEEVVNVIDDGFKVPSRDPIEPTPELTLQKRDDNITDLAPQLQPDIVHEAIEDQALEASPVIRADDQPQENSLPSPVLVASVGDDVSRNKDSTDVVEPVSEQIVEEDVEDSKPEMTETPSVGDVPQEPVADESTPSLAVLTGDDVAQEIVDVISEQQPSDNVEEEESRVSQGDTFIEEGTRSQTNEQLPPVDKSDSISTTDDHITIGEATVDDNAAIDANLTLQEEQTDVDQAATTEEVVPDKAAVHDTFSDEPTVVTNPVSEEPNAEDTKQPVAELVSTSEQEQTAPPTTEGEPVSVADSPEHPADKNDTSVQDQPETPDVVVESREVLLNVPTVDENVGEESIRDEPTEILQNDLPSEKGSDPSPEESALDKEPTSSTPTEESVAESTVERENVAVVDQLISATDDAPSEQKLFDGQTDSSEVAVVGEAVADLPVEESPAEIDASLEQSAVETPLVELSDLGQAEEIDQKQAVSVVPQTDLVVEDISPSEDESSSSETAAAPEAVEELASAIEEPIVTEEPKASVVDKDIHPDGLSEEKWTDHSSSREIEETIPEPVSTENTTSTIDDSTSVPTEIDQAGTEVLSSEHVAENTIIAPGERQAEEPIAVERNNEPASEPQLEHNRIDASTEHPDAVKEDAQPILEDSDIPSETPIEITTAESTSDTLNLTEPTISPVLGGPAIVEEVKQDDIADESGISQEVSPELSVPPEPAAESESAPIPTVNPEENPVEELAGSPEETAVPIGSPEPDTVQSVEEPEVEVPNAVDEPNKLLFDAPSTADPDLSVENPSTDAQPAEQASAPDEITEPATEEQQPIEPAASLNTEEDSVLVPSVDHQSSHDISVREEIGTLEGTEIDHATPTSEQVESTIAEPSTIIQEETAADEASATPPEPVVSEETHQELAEELTLEEPEPTIPNDVPEEVQAIDEVDTTEAPEVPTDNSEAISETAIVADNEIVEEDKSIDAVVPDDVVPVEQALAIQPESASEESISADNGESKPIDSTVETEDQREEVIAEEAELTQPEALGEAVPEETDAVGVVVAEAQDVHVEEATEDKITAEEKALDEEAAIDETVAVEGTGPVEEPVDAVSEEITVADVAPEEQNVPAQEIPVEEVSIPANEDTIPEGETFDEKVVVEDADVPVESAIVEETELMPEPALAEEEIPPNDVTVSDESQDVSVEAATVNDEPATEEAGPKAEESIPVDEVVLQKEEVLPQVSATDELPEGVVEGISEEPKAVDETAPSTEDQDLPVEPAPIEAEKSEPTPESLPVDDEVAPQETADDAVVVEPVEETTVEESATISEEPAPADVISDELPVESSVVEETVDDTVVLQKTDEPVEELKTTPQELATASADPEEVDALETPVVDTGTPVESTIAQQIIDDTVSVEKADNTVEETTAEDPEVTLPEPASAKTAIEEVEPTEIPLEDTVAPVESTIVEESETTPEEPISEEREVVAAPQEAESMEEEVAVEDQKLDGEAVEEPESTLQEPAPVEVVSEEPKAIDSVAVAEDEGVAVEEVHVEESEPLPEVKAVDDVVTPQEDDVADGAVAVEEEAPVEETTVEEPEATPEESVPEAVPAEVTPTETEAIDSVVAIAEDVPVEEPSLKEPEPTPAEPAEQVETVSTEVAPEETPSLESAVADQDNLVEETIPETTPDVAESSQEQGTSVGDEVVVEENKAIDSPDLVQDQDAPEEKPIEHLELVVETISVDDEVLHEEAEAVDATLSVSELDEMLPSPSTDLSTVDPDASFATSGPFALESVMSSIGEETGDDIEEDDDSVLGVDSKVSEVEDDVLNGTAEGNGHLAESDVGLSEPVAESGDIESPLVDVVEDAEVAEVATNGEAIDGSAVSEVPPPLEPAPVFVELNPGNGEHIDKSDVSVLGPLHTETELSSIEEANSNSAEVAVTEA